MTISLEVGDVRVRIPRSVLHFSYWGFAAENIHSLSHLSLINELLLYARIGLKIRQFHQMQKEYCRPIT